jgi:membrane-associated phospholipid phosphatase
MVGLGKPPSERLQRALRNPPHLSRLDRALALFYMTWEVEPHAILAWILLRCPERFRACAIQLAITFDATLIGYFALPTAPPWWASEREGRMDHSVRRVTLEVMRELRDEPRPGLDHSPGSNPWASMPSDHFGSAVGVAMLLYELDRRAGLVAWAYALTLGGALVYLGEHYVTDLLAGLALAVTVNRAGEAITEPMSRLLDALGGG